jgi:antitoxin component YwqK of YwqJK toxin-antitoxin module
MIGGVLSGPALTYDEAGLLTARLNYANGQIQGPAEFFHEDVRMRRSHYKAGLLEGESVDYDRQGKIVQTCVYRANVLHGSMRRFWPGGELMEEVSYRNGVPVDAPVRYDTRGRRTDNAAAAPDLLERLQKLVRGS